MDEPITDVVFVSDENECPEGYKIVSGLHAHATMAGNADLRINPIGSICESVCDTHHPDRGPRNPIFPLH